MIRVGARRRWRDFPLPLPRLGLFRRDALRRLLFLVVVLDNCDGHSHDVSMLLLQGMN